MSGDFLELKNYQLLEAADSVRRVIDQNNSQRVDENGDQIGRNYSDRVVERLKEGERILKEAAIYLHRIDYLLGNDDGPETFLSRLEEELKALK